MAIQVTTGIVISPITDLDNQNKGGGGITNALLLETGDYILLETGDKILKES